MLKTAVAGTIALLLTGLSPAFAQNKMGGTRQSVSAEDIEHLTDLRINIVRAALQLTPDQEKYWPAIESAIRTKAKDRLGRLVNEVGRVDEFRSAGPAGALRNRDPIAFMHRRADALAQRASDMKKLADAWQPLYQTLSADQKRRMAILTVVVLRDVRDGGERRRLQADDDDRGQ